MYMQRALIYCRVSTEEQAQEGYSLETQEKYCRQFAKNNGYRIVGVYRDEGRSGTTLDRPALKDLLSRVQQEQSINALVVQETDRLARNTKDHLTVRALLQKAGVRFISVAQPMLDDTPEGKMIDTIIASVNQFQSDINSRKTKKGLQEKFDTGWWPGWAPLGYVNKTIAENQKVIAPDPGRWHLIRKGLKLYLTGETSAAELSDILYEKGLRSMTGKKICNSVMTNILQNPFYAGVMKWNGQTKKGKHKAMISLAEHNSILQTLDDHNFHICRRRKHRFLLIGFLFCGICGGRYTAEKHPLKRIDYYHCAFKGKRGKDKDHTNQGQNVEVAELERQVEGKFKGIQFSDEFIALVVDKVKKIYEKYKAAVEARKRSLYNQKLAIEKKRDTAEAKLLDGVISDKDFTRIRDKLRTQMDQVQSQIDELENQRELDIDVIQEVLKLSRNIYHAYKTAPYELKRQYLGLFWDKFLVKDKRIIKAIPTKLIRGLLKEKKVIIRGNWLPSPKLIITLQDWEYTSKLRERITDIKQTLAAAG
jgi:site-specific DNA recombinase